MTQRQVARALGISKNSVAVIEAAALLKVAAALGLPPPRVTAWVARCLEHRVGRRRCGECGERGHLAPTCPRRLALAIADAVGRGEIAWDAETGKYVTRDASR